MNEKQDVLKAILNVKKYAKALKVRHQPHRKMPPPCRKSIFSPQMRPMRLLPVPLFLKANDKRTEFKNLASRKMLGLL